MSYLLHCADRIALLVVAVVAVLGAAAAPAVADDAVLLAATVPGYTPGMVVAPTDRISIPDGASATLLFRSGGLLRLRGPFEGTLAQQQAGAGESKAAELADMFRMRGVDATVVGGTRSLGSTYPTKTIEDVEVDPEHSGTYCIESATTIWVRRPSNEQGGFAVRRKGSSRALAWTSRAARSEWPPDVPAEDGDQFEIVADGKSVAMVTFRALPASATGPARIAAGMLLGCHDQFDAELRRLNRAIADPAVWITTDHGRRPTYSNGEPILLTVTTDMDGFLYCVAARDDSGAMSIFPGGAVDGAELHGSTPLAVPGLRQRVGLTAMRGATKIRCWLADRDIARELPHALVDAPNGRLPDQITGDLDNLFSRVSGTRVAKDSLTIQAD